MQYCFDLRTDLKSYMYCIDSGTQHMYRRPEDLLCLHTMMMDSVHLSFHNMNENQYCDTIKKSNNVPLNVCVTLLQ